MRTRRDAARPMSLLVVGLSHRSAPVALLERASVSGTRWSSCSHDVLAGDHVAEAMVALHLQPGRGLRRGGQVPRRGRRAVRAARPARGRPPGRAHPAPLRALRGPGRPAPVLGRPAAWTRWSWARARSSARSRSALALAQERGTAGRDAQRALPAGTAGRQARPHRDRHRPGRAASLVSVGLDPRRARPRPAGQGKRALVVGAGSMCALAAATLQRAGVADIVVAQPDPRPRRTAGADGRRPGRRVRRADGGAGRGRPGHLLHRRHRRGHHRRHGDARGRCSCWTSPCRTTSTPPYGGFRA